MALQLDLLVDLSVVHVVIFCLRKSRWAHANVKLFHFCLGSSFVSPPVQVVQWAHMHHFLSVVRLDLTRNGSHLSAINHIRLLI